jgi:hypothetical protein
MISEQTIGRDVEVRPPQWSDFLATDPKVPGLPDFLRRSRSKTGYTQTREDNGGAISRK